MISWKDVDFREAAILNQKTGIISSISYVSGEDRAYQERRRKAKNNMPEYRIEPTLTFLYKYLPGAPSDIRKKLFYDLLRKLQQDSSRSPLPNGNEKKLKGYINLYRLRKDDYRQ